jgi:hypothetical protein
MSIKKGLMLIASGMFLIMFTISPAMSEPKSQSKMKKKSSSISWTKCCEMNASEIDGGTTTCRGLKNVKGKKKKSRVKGKKKAKWEYKNCPKPKPASKSSEQDDEMDDA